jgi:mRNA interferase RelE/StbE
MQHKVELHPEAKKDFDSLDGSVKKEVIKKLDALARNPLIGAPLGSKYGIDLTGFYKIYVYKKSYRIVYRIVGDYVEIIEIVAIGRRDKEAVYRLLAKRLKNL